VQDGRRCLVIISLQNYAAYVLAMLGEIHYDAVHVLLSAHDCFDAVQCQHSCLAQLLWALAALNKVLGSVAQYCSTASRQGLGRYSREGAACSALVSMATIVILQISTGGRVNSLEIICMSCIFDGKEQEVEIVVEGQPGNSSMLSTVPGSTATYLAAF
jgi:hypothetical protein